MLSIGSSTDQTTNTIEHSATVEVQVTIVQGSEFINSHTVIGKFRKPTYFVELWLDDVKAQTSGAQKAENAQYVWDEHFIFAANRSSRLSLKLYCKHSNARSNHVIGEAMHDVWDIPRYENETIDLHDAEKRVSGKITLCLTVAATVTFSAGPAHSLELQSDYLTQMTKIIGSLSGEELDKFSPVWRRFIQSLGIVASTAQKISELHPSVQVALGAVAFAVKIVLEQIDRDERIEGMVDIMGDLYAYVADAYPIEKITSYKETLRRLLAQTTECSYFIGEYRKVTQFARRVVVNLVSDADTMIKKFEDTFRDMKVELILGSSLQTAVVSFRVLQKVENIETILYTKELKPLEDVGWDSDRTCFRGTRNDIIDDVVQWASNSQESGMAKNNRIYILQGPQGCGKSSIAHSVAQAFHLQNRLGAAIFLDDRTDERVIGSQILSTTIASQLAAYDQIIREAIAAKIKADASLAKADAGRQFRDLIVSATKGLALIGPICIVIDGLQKVNPVEQLRLLTAIAKYFTDLPSNFRLLLTSGHGHTSEHIARFMADCLIKEIAFDDEGTIIDFGKHISQSLRHLFSKKLRLAKKYEGYTIEDLRDQFIERSMGVYLWISTAFQFLLLCTDGDECAMMDNILSTKLPLTNEVAMDQLFCIILTSIPAAHVICRALIQSSKPLPLQDLSPKVSDSASQSTYHSLVLDMMQPLLIENGDDETDSLLFTIHPSVEDFLTSSRRCHGTIFYADRLDPTPLLSMANICFDMMEGSLRQDICNLDDVMVLNEEITDRDKRLNQYIPGTLQYACRNWMFHLEALNSDGKEDDITSALERLDRFLSKHLLHWIECMSLLGWVDVISASLNRLYSWQAKYRNRRSEVRYVLTNSAIHFIHMFAPIISKAPMQTYLSALLLMPSDSLLFKKHSASMVQPSVKLSGPASGRSICRMIYNPRVIVSNTGRTVYDSTSSYDATLLALSKSGASGTSNEIKFEYSAISPDGQWIATWNMRERDLNIWNVETGSYARTIAEGNAKYHFITYSADGKKLMFVGTDKSPFYEYVIWDVTTDTLVKRLKLSKNVLVAISPDGSKIAVADQSHIRITDVSTGRDIGEPTMTPYGKDACYPTNQFIWSPNGQFLVSVTKAEIHPKAAMWSSADIFTKSEIYLLSFGNSIKLLNPCVESRNLVFDLACSPNSSKVAAIYSHGGPEMTLFINCTRTGNLIRTTSFTLASTKARIAFTSEENILVFGHDYNRGTNVLLRFNVVPMTHFIQINAQYPLKFHPSETPLAIEYSHDISGAVVDYASQVDADGWIRNTQGQRQMWTPWANYVLSCSCKPPQEGQTQYRTLEVKDPETRAVVLRYVIAFERCKPGAENNSFC